MLRNTENLLKNRAKQRWMLEPVRVICLSFFLVIVTGGLLLMLPFATREGYIAPVDAFFTATSATCVTGLVVKDTWQTFTLFGQIVIISLIQIGGLGLVTIVAFFNFAIGRRLGLRDIQLASESTGTGEVFSAKKQVFSIIKTALAFELAGAVLLSFYFVPRFGLEGIYISIFAAISSFCNAGFDILSRTPVPFTSLTNYSDQPYLLLVISALIICGGLGFVVWHDIVAWRKTKHLVLHSRIVLLMTAILLVGGTVGIFLMERNNPATMASQPVWEKWLSAFFQSVSSRTAGYNSIDCAAMNGFTKLFMSILMFIGAGSGSTGGGIKVTTFAVLAVTVISATKGKENATIFGHTIEKRIVYKSLAIFTLALFLTIASGMTIFYNTGPAISEVDSVFEAASAFATVGLSVGATPVMNTPAKLITMLTMFVGRCGPVGFATLLTIRGGKSQQYTILPRAKLLVG